MPEIVIKIDKKTWKPILEGIGYHDGKCVTDIDEISSILGGRILADHPKPELVRHRQITRTGAKR